mgnify:FL=1
MDVDNKMEDCELRERGIDTELDAITSLLGILTGSPLNLIFKIDKGGAFIISSTGLDAKNTFNANYLTDFVTSASQEILVIKDSSKEAKLSKNPLVNSSPGIVFYIGVPLKTSNGEIWGMLCSIDFVTKELDEKTIKGLKILGGQTTKLLELEKSYADLALTKKHLNSETSRLNNILEATQLGTWEWDIVKNEVVINEQFAIMLGYNFDELSPFTMDKWYKILHPEDRFVSDNVLNACFNKELDYYNIECRLLHKKGHEVWVNDRGRVTKWSSTGKPLQMSGTHSDITKRKINEIQFQTVSDNIPGVVYRYKRTISGKDIFELVSNGANQIWGFTSKQVMENSDLVGDRCHKDDLQGLITSIDESAKTLTFWSWKYRYQHPDGSIRWHKGAGSPRKLDDGSVIWDSVIIDVTKRKETEEKLEITLSSLQKRIKEQDCIYKISRLDFSWSQIDGLFQSAADILPTAWSNPGKISSKITFENKEYYSSAFKPYEFSLTEKYEVKERGALLLEIFIEKDPGRFLEIGEVDNDSRLVNTLVYHLGTYIDQLSSQEALNVSNRKINSIIESNPGIFWESHPKTFQVNYISPQVKNVLGYSVEEWKKKSHFWEDHIHEDDKEPILKLISEKSKSDNDFTIEYRFLDKNGNIKWISDFIKVIKEPGKEPLYRGLMVDITKRKVAEIALRENEKRFKALIENGQDAIVVFDADGVPKYISSSIISVLGYTEEEAFQLKLNESVHPDDLELSLEKFEKSLTSPGVPIEGYVIRSKHKDGSWRWMESTITNFLDDPDINGIVDNFRDITETVELNEKLAKSEKRFKALVQEGSDLTAILSIDSNYIYVSPSYCPILGYEESEMIGESAISKIHPDDLERAVTELKGIVSQHRMKCSPFRYKRKNGTWCWLLSTATNLLDDPAIGGLVFNSVDITELIEAQEKLVTSEARYKGFFESQTTFVIRTDLDGVITFANTKYMETFDWLFPGNSYEGINVVTTILEEEKSKIREVIKKCLEFPEKVHKVELRKLKKENGFYTTLWDFVGILGADGQPKEIQCNGIDISERIAFEEELKKSNERFELVMQTDSGSIWDLDPYTGEMFLGEGFRKNFGLEIQTPSKNYNVFCDSIYDKDRKLYQKRVQQIIYSSSDTQWEIEYRLIKSNGECAYVKEKAVILRDDNGNAYRIVGAIKDKTLEYFYGKLEGLEKDIMEGSMNQKAKLSDLLTNYLTHLEILFPKVKTAVFKVYGNRLRNLATPSLLGQDHLAFKDFEINLNEENNLEFTKNEVFISNINKDKKCTELKFFANKIGLNSCWSLPILNSDGKLIAVFLNLFEGPNKLGDWESYAIQKSQRLLSLVLTKYEYLENIYRSNERFNYVNMATNDVIFDWDCNLDEFHWGEGFYRIFGYSKGEEISKISEWASFMHPVDAKVTDAIWDDFVNDPSENGWNKEYRFLHKSGLYLHVEESSYMIRDADGKPLRMIGVLRDISGIKEDLYQKEMQQEIGNHFKNEADLNKTLQGVLSYLVDFSGLFGGNIWLLGKKGVEINLIQNNFPSETPNWLADAIYEIGIKLANHVMKEGVYFESEILNEDPRFNGVNPKIYDHIKFIIGIPLYQNNNLIGVLLLYIDSNSTLPQDCKSFFEPIGVLLGGEVKRKQQEEEMRLLFESAPEVLTIIDPNGYFVKVNPSFCSVFGYEEEEMLTKKFVDLIHPEDRDFSIQKFSIKEGIQAKNLINRYQTKSGQYRWISWNSSYEFGEEGLVFSFGHDITELVALQTLLDNASKLSRVGSWEIDLLNNELYLSATTREIYELPPESLPTVEDLLKNFEGDSNKFIKEALYDAINEGKSWDYEAPVTLPDGKQRWVRSIAQSEFNNGRCVRISGSLQDIHEQKINEIELAKNNQLLEVISKVVEKFLLVEDWREVINDVFLLTSQTVFLDRIYFFENHWDERLDEVLCSKKIDWYQSKLKKFNENDQFQNIALKDYPEMTRVLENGEVFIANAKELPNCKLKNTLEEGGIYSTLIIPIMIHNKFFGFIGFDDCTSERIWTESEISFLLALTSNLSAAIQRTNSQLALERSFQEKNTILESIGEAFYAVDNDFKVLYWNQRAEDIIGVSRSETLGNLLWDAVPRLVNSYTQEQLFNALESQSNIHYEMFSEVRKIWLVVNLYPSTEGISVFIKDITSEKLTSEKIQLSNERFEKIAEATNDAIYDYDTENDLLFRGIGFNTLFGYDLQSQESGVESLRSLIHPEDKERVSLKFMEFIKSNELTNWFEEYRLLCKDGNYAFVMDRAIFIRDKNKKVTRVVGAITDITYRREYEESLQTLNEQMAQHAKELERSNSELEQFAYVASHDLQEPLRMVSNFMGLLERKYSDKLDDKAHQYINFAVDGAMRMRRIILDLLEFSRIGKHEDKLKILNFMDLVDEVCVLQKKRIRESNAIIKYNNLPTVISYRTPLFQILYNLIGNALKYKNEKETPVVEIKAEIIGEFWQFSVIDNGIGIAPENHERIFTIFNRLHTKEKYEGTGMGLAIVKKIIDNLGGEVWVKSQVGDGATFYFTLPRLDLELEVKD